MAMRNRKTIITAFVLVAVMLMAVGFAALSTDLFIAGNATISADRAQTEFDTLIKFDEVKSSDIVTTSTGSTAHVLTKTNDKQMDISVNSLALNGETATFTFRVLNESTEHDALASIETFKIMGNTLTANGDGVYTDSDGWISAKVVWTDTDLEKAVDAENLGEASFQIIFTLLKTPTEQVVRSINITIDATTVD